jgi:hypothetical protein
VLISKSSVHFIFLHLNQVIVLPPQPNINREVIERNSINLQSTIFTSKESEHGEVLVISPKTAYARYAPTLELLRLILPQSHFYKNKE